MGSSSITLKRSVLASSIAAACVIHSPNLLAQAEEELVVTGIRASLQRSMDIKRDSAGVVDAISAEDIGKFPDTNLAESLQRITGVSISRSNGEGSEVTVRGFGPNFNMITLNGRTMPGGIAYGGGSGAGGTRGGATRAFDFANLASESVSAVEVYKTSKADIATGGMGGTINILTARPLDNPGFKASVGAKAMHDTTNRTGSDITPELSGLLSWTTDNEVFGVAVSGSYQERDSGSTQSTVNDWNIGRWGEDTLYSVVDESAYENTPDEGQLYARPNDMRYAFSDVQRARTNGQLTLQYRPVETLTITGDFTYAENEIEEHRGEQTFWIANNTSVDHVLFNDAIVAAPLLISETLSGKDAGFEQQYRKQTNTLESTGLNIDWQVTDRFSLAFDVHDSSMESLPTGPGSSGEVATSIGAPILTSQQIDWRGDLPKAAYTYDDSGRGNNNGVMDPGDFGSQVVRVWYAAQGTDVTQLKLDGAFEFDNGRIDFGVETRAMEAWHQQSDRYMAMGDWGIANPGEFPDGMVQEFSLVDEFNDYATGSQSFGVKGDSVELANFLIGEYGTPDNGYVLAYNPVLAEDNKVEEDTTALFVQLSMEGQLGDMPTNVLAGVRYESTEVTSTSLVNVPEYLIWQDNNDFQVYRDPNAEAQPFSGGTRYDYMLPSFDFSIDFTDSMKGRASYSKTIARAGLGDLRSSVSQFGTVGSTYNGTTPTASSYNPALLPLESDNFDVSFEWYYADSSYASVGLFEKRVQNFIGTEQVDQPHFGILDQTNGPRADAAAQALADNGMPLDDTTLFVMMAVLDNPADFPGGAADYANAADRDQFAIDVATAYDLVPEAGDPEMVFRTSRPANNKQANLWGAELALQHFFGDTGFGVQANYTVVRSDTDYNNATDPSVSQFALTGLSDTANLVAMYENYGWQARIAYNWRDSYLNETSRGNSRNPVYVDAYSQVDLNVSYDFDMGLSVFFEGLNVTGENERQHARTESMLWFLSDLGPRYTVGARYTF